MACTVAKGAETRRHIMRSAEAVFAERGFAAASISDISAAAGVNRALIYYYFKDKDDLYRSIVADGDECVKAIAREAASSPGSALGRLRKFMVLFSAMLMERHNLIRIVVRRELDVSMDHTGLLALLKAVIAEGIENGELRDVDPEETAFLLIGIVHTITALQRKVMPERASAEIIDHAMSLLADGIALRS